MAAQGIRQGPTDAPPGHTFNSDVCQKCYDKKAKGCIIRDPMQQLIQHRNLDQNVDDTTKQHNASRYNQKLKDL
eukprot:12889925-Ditylum_brightwellii.AAC.1